MLVHSVTVTQMTESETVSVYLLKNLFLLFSYVWYDYDECDLLSVCCEILIILGTINKSN